MALEDGVEISISRSNEVVIVGVEGRLDSTTSSRLEDELLGLIAKAEHRLILDCSRLVYISSAGLRAVLLAAKRLKNAGACWSCAHPARRSGKYSTWQASRASSPCGTR